MGDLVIWACDVGYGHVKFADGRDELGVIHTEVFPSRSLGTKLSELKGGSVQPNRDTITVNIDGAFYEVGREIDDAAHPNQESEILDEDFALSPGYAARLYGAMSYMSGNTSMSVVDYLVLGLPLNNWKRLHEQVSMKFRGEHLVDKTGKKVMVKECHVFPQPLGSYQTYFMEEGYKVDQVPNALIIDPGYNTIDWFVCRGMKVQTAMSGAVMRGVAAVLRDVAMQIKEAAKYSGSMPELIRSIDTSLVKGTPFKMYGDDVDLSPYLDAGAGVINEAVQAVKNSVGAGLNIDVVVLTGGGANLYERRVREVFPRHKVICLDNPSTGNVRGFYLLGELMASSARRAVGT